MNGKSLIPKGWEVPGIFRRRLGNKVGRQRLMVAVSLLAGCVLTAFVTRQRALTKAVSSAAGRQPGP